MFLYWELCRILTSYTFRDDGFVLFFCAPHKHNHAKKKNAANHPFNELHATALTI